MGVWQERRSQGLRKGCTTWNRLMSTQTKCVRRSTETRWGYMRHAGPKVFLIPPRITVLEVVVLLLAHRIVA